MTRHLFTLSLAASTSLSAADWKAPESPLLVDTKAFQVPEGLEVTVWASSPQLYNPTNMDIDAAGRIWVAEGVNYRRHNGRRPGGDRIAVLQDTDGDGKADSSHTFVQEKGLVAPLGVGVFDNVIVVSQPPDLIVYTDVDRDLKFDPATDTREVLLSGFSGINHDHSLHSVTAGPDGKWYFNSGNTGGMFTDRSGKTFISYGSYRPKVIGPYQFPHDASAYAGQASDDGHVYVGGFTVRMNPDGTHSEIIGHNYRNSYEQSVTSFGDVFQNDNDDPPACRVSWVMEYANFGFSSNDGQRTWKADRRPGQDTPTAEWRQDDPGSAPAGDVYGGGSPTGNVFYENGALGDDWIGTFLACEPGRNVVFSYQPKLEGAGFQLDRKDFVTSNAEGKWAGSDFLGGSNSVNEDTATLFRPSDIAIGPDGALYISDWYDGRVGGHQDLDETCSGAIYRIAPKGFQPKVPTIDIETTAGQIAALKSPAPNVRHLGFNALAAQGEAVIDAVKQVLEEKNPFVAARGIWLLARLGDKGQEIVRSLLKSDSEPQRIAAYRALRRANGFDKDIAGQMSIDSSAAVRREVALSLRDIDASTAAPLLAVIARGYDGRDRSYLEAFGTGASKKEAEVYAAVKAQLGDEDPLKWSNAFARIAWRLHPESAVADVKKRALSDKLIAEQRKLATDTLAFTPVKAAADAMLDIAAADSPNKANATWWLLNRSSNDWKDFDLMPELAKRGIYDPKKVVVQEIISPDPKDTPNNLPPVAEILALKGDVEKGKLTAQRCIMCHQIEGIGIEYGPTLTGWGKTQTREVIANSIIDPSSDIAHGYDGTQLKTQDGKTVHGLLIKEGNPLIITSMGGVTQIVPAGKVKNKSKMNRSLMLSAAQLGLTAQDVADLIAYLKSI
jgi:putative membrane-bound dehydrogenase-like protein